MKTRPIIFSGQSPRAILDGRKTQTRRVVKPQPPPECSIHYMLGNELWLPVERRAPLRHTWEAWGGPLYEKRPARHLCGAHAVVCPYGGPGDRLWVRETWAEEEDACGQRRYLYRANEDESFLGWSPSIFMPRALSRLTLEVTGVRVERVQNISEADAQAEGVGRESDPEDCTPDDGVLADECGYFAPRSYVGGFRATWDALNKKRGFGWDLNPWVWVLKFRRISSGDVSGDAPGDFGRASGVETVPFTGEQP